MPSRAAGTVEITVLAGMGWCGVPDVAPAFERITGHKVIVHGEIVVAGVRKPAQHQTFS